MNHNWEKPLVISLLLAMLAGCTSNWRAPLESREGQSTRSQKTTPVSRNNLSKSPFKTGHTSYRVRKGDTLYAIAWRSNTDFKDLARWNQITKPYTIHIDQRIRLRVPTRPSSKSSQIIKQKAASAAKQTKPVKMAKKKAGSHKSTAVSFNSNRRLRWLWPYKGKLVSTYKRGDTLRKGIEMAGKEGGTIKAAESGRIVYSGSGLIGYGKLIIIKHNDKYLSAYGHNRKLLVKEGQQVTKGTQIAELGKSNNGVPLLHFEIRRDGKPVNPIGLLPKR